MNLKFVRPALTTAAVLAAAAIRGPALGAQMPMQHPMPTPAIVTSAMEEVEVAPDRAMLSLAVETRAASAAEAGRLNARIQAAVIDTLKKLGIPSAQLRTQGLSIAAEYDYSREVGRQFIGYGARNAIQIEVRDIAMVGTLVDAGLAKGATNVGGVRFYASNISVARREALKRAVERVRADAALMAEAAGGSLGGLIELIHSPSFDGAVAYDAPVAMAMKQSSQERTPIEAGMLKVSVSVSARFGFLSK